MANNDLVTTPPRNLQPSNNPSAEPRPLRPSPLRQSITTSGETTTAQSPLLWRRATSNSSDPRPAIRGGRRTIVNPLRRAISGNNPNSSATRTVSFNANPVTMSQSPPQLSLSSDTSDSAALQGRDPPRSASVPPTMGSNNSSDDLASRSSVKHLTCFWWKEKGTCKFSEDECLYAHHDTGRYTEAPRQINPDEPAKAGRNLARALDNFVLQRGHRSSGSIQLGSPTGSRPTTPLSANSSSLSLSNLMPRTRSPLGQEVLTRDTKDMEEQIELYRKILATNDREKAIMVEYMDELKIKLDNREAIIRRIESDKNFLTAENQALRAAILGPNYAAATAPTVATPTGGLGDGLVNSFAGLNVGNIPAWAPAAGVVDRPVSPNTNPSEDGDDYLDMIIRGNGSGI